jgi:Uma2 family endonuclease
MAADPRRSPLSLADFEALPKEDLHRLELVRGRVVREPRPAPLHAMVAGNVYFGLRSFVEPRGLGVVLADAGFLLAADPPTVRAPDVAWVSAGRLPSAAWGTGYWRLAPDIAVEVVSPTNRYGALRAKAAEYLGAGSRQVWIVDPPTKSAEIHERGSRRNVAAPHTLIPGDVLPGLTLPLSTIFTPAN